MPSDYAVLWYQLKGQWIQEIAFLYLIWQSFCNFQQKLCSWLFSLSHKITIREYNDNIHREIWCAFHRFKNTILMNENKK